MPDPCALPRALFTLGRRAHLKRRSHDGRCTPSCGRIIDVTAFIFVFHGRVGPLGESVFVQSL